MRPEESCVVPRWTADGCNLSSLQTTRVAPVDLNAFLYKMETDMVLFAQV